MILTFFLTNSVVFRLRDLSVIWVYVSHEPKSFPYGKKKKEKKKINNEIQETVLGSATVECKSKTVPSKLIFLVFPLHNSFNSYVNP